MGKKSKPKLQQQPLEDPASLFPWCSWCGEQDHRWRACPEGLPADWCGRCEEYGHNWAGCPYAPAQVSAATPVAPGPLVSPTSREVRDGLMDKDEDIHYDLPRVIYAPWHRDGEPWEAWEEQCHPVSFQEVAAMMLCYLAEDMGGAPPVQVTEGVELPVQGERGEVRLPPDLLSEEPAAFPLLSEEPAACPLLSEEPAACPLLSEEPAAFPLLSEEPAAFPLLSEEPAAFPLLSEEPATKKGGEVRELPPPQPRPPSLQASPALPWEVPCPGSVDTGPECADLPPLDLAPRSQDSQAQSPAWSLAPLPLDFQMSLRRRKTSPRNGQTFPLLVASFPLPTALLPLESQTSLRRSTATRLCLPVRAPGHQPALWSPWTCRLGPSLLVLGPSLEMPEGPTHPQARPWKRAKISRVEGGGL
ncbi:UNVERIFIED_CONTAM: hypothetical protein FKN15_027740 [Acipenser sinensis]